NKAQNKRVELRLAGKTRAEQNTAVSLILNKIKDQSSLLEQYRSVRRERWELYQKAKQEAIQAEMARLGRPEKDIVLSLYWAPPGDRPKPITPWIYDPHTEAVVEEVITAFITGTEPDLKVEDDELPPFEEEVEERTGPTWEEHIEMLRQNDKGTYHYGPGHGWLLPSSNAKDDAEEQDPGIQLDSMVEQNTMPESGDAGDENIDPVLLNG
ncbi:hypothetical protein N0V85_009872, partial [Neurospora sp. IMI 360204]